MRVHLKRVALILISFGVTVVFWLSFSSVDHDLHNPLVYVDSKHPLGVLFRSVEKPTFIRVFKQLYQPEMIRERIKTLGQPDRHHWVWPSGLSDKDDRIVAQLNFRPPATGHKSTLKLKKILAWDGDLKLGQEEFISRKCLVNKCMFVSRERHLDFADLVMFNGIFNVPYMTKPPGQIWMVAQLEAPRYASPKPASSKLINWTASYRHDSTFVTPYAKFVPFVNDADIKLASTKNYAAGKTKQVAWFVSNCFSQNMRENYAMELSKYISVDIYGYCGPLECPRGPDDEHRCYSKLNTEYKFYLSFENANCRDYITEKLFVLGLKHDVVPIVMGAAPEDYERAAPYHSYIHVEQFASPKELASYLHLLDTNDDLYNTYFAWRGKGEFIDAQLLCRVCALLHDEHIPQRTYERIDDWWNGSHVCIGRERWDFYRAHHKVIA